MAKYIPFPAYPKDAPLDFRFAYGDPEVAGCHGFLKVDGDHFTFEDGTVARFWGTCFNSGANFPTHEYAEAVSLRLAKIGCNMVRFHQLDSEWSTPNIFSFTKGQRQKDSRHLDPDSMERLDYLIACLKKNGIYMYMDMFTYRKFKSGDDVEAAFLLGDAAKPYGCYNRRLIALQKELADQLWNHINPYTGLAYKDDPAIALCEIVNETDLVNRPLTVEPYVTEARELYAEWLKENGITGVDAFSCDMNGTDESLISFKMHVQTEYYAEMRDYMRKIGIRIPINGTNWSWPRAVARTQISMDFMDDHPYFWTADWGEEDRYSAHTGVTDQKWSFLGNAAAARWPDKPLFISEWDMIWPNAKRAESVLYAAAIGLLQGWSGFTIHTYAYSTMLENALLGKEFSCASIGSVPYREGIFTTWNDPAKFGLFYHAALMTRRGDVKRSGSVTAVERKCDFHLNDNPGLDGACDLMEIGAAYTDVVPERADRIVPMGEELISREAEDVRSDTGELYRNWVKHYGTIDTPRTKAAYGSLGKLERLELDGLCIKSKTDFAVVALSSLTDDSISKSDNLLLTAVGHARNRGAQFENDQLINYGTGPIEIEVIETDVEIKTEKSTLCIWAISAEGYYIGRVPAVYEDGWLRFTLGKQFPSMYYLIIEE